MRPCCGAKWGHSWSHARRPAGAQSRGIACPLSKRRGTGAGGTADGQRGKDVSAAWSEGSVSPQCCLPLLLLAPAGAASLSRCCLQRRSCWLLCCCLFRRGCAPVVFAADFVGCCCGAGPWRNAVFLFLFLFFPPSLLKSIGHGSAQARPSAQNSPVYASQAPFCLCFAGVWSGPVLYKDRDWPPTGHSLILSVKRVKRPPPCNRNHPRAAPGRAFIHSLCFRGRETKYGPFVSILR